MTNIGNKIKERREELGMSQDELAIKMGYKSRSTITKIETGVNDVVQSNIVKFADALHTTPSYLMGWLEPVEENPVEMATIHAEIIMDEEYVNMYENFKLLDEAQKKIVKDLINSLAATKKGSLVAPK